MRWTVALGMAVPFTLALPFAGSGAEASECQNR